VQAQQRLYRIAHSTGAKPERAEGGGVDHDNLLRPTSRRECADTWIESGRLRLVGLKARPTCAGVSVETTVRSFRPEVERKLEHSDRIRPDQRTIGGCQYRALGNVAIWHVEPAEVAPSHVCSFGSNAPDTSLGELIPALRRTRSARRRQSARHARARRARRVVGCDWPRGSAHRRGGVLLAIKPDHRWMSDIDAGASAEGTKRTFWSALPFSRGSG
jgi:hypothetical protein